MLAKLVGFSKLDFTSNDGSPVKGTNLFVNMPDPDVEGLVATKLFIKDGFSLPNLVVGMDLEVDFNHKGKPAFITSAQQQSPKAAPSNPPVKSTKA